METWLRNIIVLIPKKKVFDRLKVRRETIVYRGDLGAKG